MSSSQFQVLKRQKPWRDAYYYQKAETLYQMTFVFCQRFLPVHGDRTVDQMVQAARSGKQNIVEGTEDGTTSTEMHIKLLNVARASLQELREDYRDYLISRQLPLWNATHPRYHQMQTFCKAHNRLEEYNPYLEKWNDEEMANIALTLCHMTDAMLNHHLKNLEKEFVEQGGIKERMYAARTGYRQHQDAELASLRADNTRLKADNAALQAELTRLRDLLAQYGFKL
jgi:four helix bundle suffix protein